MSHNTKTLKNKMLLNGAGEDEYNPILEGLPLDLKARFNKVGHNVSLLTGNTTPPTTQASFNNGDDLTKTLEAVAGSSPLNIVDSKTFISLVFQNTTTEKQTVWEKETYIASLPDDAVQIYDVNSGWTSVNTDKFGTTPLCSQQCGIRFFNGWYDEFGVRHYGGVRYVSIYDGGTEEGDTSSYYVKRMIKKDISSINYASIVKHKTNEEEGHSIRVAFRSKKDSDEKVVVEVQLRTLACYGFQVYVP